MGLLEPVVTSDPPVQRTHLYGRYEVLSFVGSGGMGSVYRVWDTALEEEVALKLVRADRLQAPGVLGRFRQEVKLARRVSHPNVVRTYDLGEHDGECFLTMEYVRGRSLRRALVEDGPLPTARAVAIARGIAEGIAAAHEVGVLHCDLKPDNILLGDGNRVALTDFGIARVFGRADGVVTGTPAYMAPEQTWSDLADPRTDLYALGAVLFEMLTGRPVWSGEDLQHPRRWERAIPDLRQLVRVPDALATLVSQALAPRLEDRPSSARALAARLAAVEIASNTPTPDLSLQVPSQHAPSVAVLPMKNLGGAEDAHLAFGLTEELVDALAATRGLRVRPLATTLALTTGIDPVSQGRALGVSVVVEGTLRRRGDGLAVTVRLHGVDDGFQLWAQRALLPERELLSCSDALAAEIAGALATEARVSARANAVDPIALDLYLRARQELRAGWDDGITRAIALLGHAMTRAPEDPNILSTYAMALARQTFFESMPSEQRRAQLSRARKAAESAIQAAPQSGDGWVAAGHVHLYLGDVSSAALALREGVRRSPGVPRAQQMLGNIALECGRVSEAVTRLEAALAIDPDGTQAIMDLSRAYALSGRWADVDRLLEREPTAGQEAPVMLAFCRARLSLWAPGRSFNVPEIGPEPSHAARMMQEVVQDYKVVAEGGPPPASLLGMMQRAPDTVHPLRVSVWTQCGAEICGWSGDLDRALMSVRQAVSAGLHDLLWMERCPPLAPLRALPEWADLLATVRQRANKVRIALDA